MTDYKKYSLEQLENWIHDSFTSDATPKEIYDTIYNLINEQYHYFKHHTGRAYDLLVLLNGNQHHIESSVETKLTDEKKMNHMDMIEAGYNMTADGFWVKEYNESEEKKWNLLVEEDMASGDCYVTLPENLLSTVNWKEGDQIQWKWGEDNALKLSKVDET